MDHLVPRRLYVIRARNLSMGVWEPVHRGFVGIREKFNSRFLDVEYHRDTGAPFGTATELEDTGTDLPTGMRLSVHETDAILCRVCRTPVHWMGPPAPAPWLHLDSIHEDDHKAEPTREMNRALFDWLDVRLRAHEGA